MQRDRVGSSLLLGALGFLACSGEGADDTGASVPAYVGPLPAVGTPPAASSNTTPSNTAPPAVSASPTGAAGTGNGSEGGVLPTGLDPSGAGGASSSSGATSGASAGTGGAPAPAGTGGAGGSTMAAAGSGAEPPVIEPPVEPPPVEPPPVEPPPVEPPPVAAPTSCPQNALFCDDFEDDAAGQFPGAPWQNQTGSGATVRVDGLQAFSGSQAAHVNAPPNGAYRRGYFSLGQQSGVFPAASREMFGRAMMFLDATPNAVVHWTIIQAEGPAADGTHDAYYRYGGQQQGGAGLMANYETNNGVSTDCYSHSGTRMPVQRWACVEWHFDAQNNEMQLWLDGTEITDMHVVDRPTSAGAGCLGNDVGGQWLAPPAFTTLHLGWESYQTSSNDRNLWVDDVAVATERVGCPSP